MTSYLRSYIDTIQAVSMNLLDLVSVLSMFQLLYASIPMFQGSNVSGSISASQRFSVLTFRDGEDKFTAWDSGLRGN